MDPIVLLLWLLAALLVLVGLAGAVLPVIPGVPLVFAGVWLGAWRERSARALLPRLSGIPGLVGKSGSRPRGR